MANKKVIIIQSIVGSVEHPADAAKPSYDRRKIIINQPPSYVVEYEDVVADKLVEIGFAIPFIGCETNPKCPPRIRFQK